MLMMMMMMMMMMVMKMMMTLVQCYVNSHSAPLISPPQCFPSFAISPLHPKTLLMTKTQMYTLCFWNFTILLAP